ncbi:peptide ABC transporter, permease protein [Desulfosarcina variabilis str. Montpellier]
MIGWSSLSILGTFLVLCLISPVILPHSPTDIVALPLQPPGDRHWLGTNELGQDLLCRVLAGGQNSIMVGLVGAGLATLIGTALGMIAGYFGGRIDQFLSRLTDVIIAVPVFPLLIILSAYYALSLHALGLIMGALGWCPCARIVRAQALSLSQWPFVQGVRAMGAGHIYILGHYILPFVLPLSLVKFIFALQGYLLMGVGLGFIGLGGAQTIDWGWILNHAFTSGGLSMGCWWWFLAPVGAIVATSLSIAMIGYSLEQRHEPLSGGRNRWSVP